jgi:uncharacterized protein DUF1259
MKGQASIFSAASIHAVEDRDTSSSASFANSGNASRKFADLCTFELLSPAFPTTANGSARGSSSLKLYGGLSDNHGAPHRSGRLTYAGREVWRTIVKTWTLMTVATLVTLSASIAIAQDVPSDYQQVLTTLGKTGDFKDNVLKVNFPRNDVKVTVGGVDTPTPFGFGGWIALTKASDGNQVMMGDLVLLENEVNPVMSALLDNGFDVTALHNHFFHDDPHMFYMHVHGHGSAADIARRLKPAVDLIGKGRSPVQQTSTNQLDGAKLAQIIGHPGEQTGAVYKITIGRDDIKMTEMGASLNARMGLNTWAAFTGTNEKAAIAGDVAMLESEVTPVLKALRKNGLEVVAIHHHMTSDRPMVIFLHYWGTGQAEALANGFKAALNELGKHGTPAANTRSGR